MTQCLGPLLYAGNTEYIARRDEKSQALQAGIDHFQDKKTDDQDPGDSDQRNEDWSVDQTKGVA